MQSLADRIYTEQEKQWSAAHPDLDLHDDDVPETVTAEVDESLPCFVLGDEHHPGVLDNQMWRTVRWNPGLGEIHEDNGDRESIPSLGRSEEHNMQMSKETAEAREAPNTMSRNDVDFKKLSHSKEREIEDAAWSSDSLHSLTTTPALPSYSRPIHATAMVGRRQSSITGTTRWTSNSIHYRIRTKAGQGSISGASAFSGKIEVDGVPAAQKVRMSRTSANPI